MVSLLKTIAVLVLQMTKLFIVNVIIRFKYVLGKINSGKNILLKSSYFLNTKQMQERAGF